MSDRASRVSDWIDNKSGRGHASPLIESLDDGIREEALAQVDEEWGGPMIASRGRLLDIRRMSGFVCREGDRVVGVALYHVEGLDCEVAALLSRREGLGIGSGLLRAVIARAQAMGCARVWLITSNDNTHAIRFYQRFGFSLKAVHMNAMDRSRELKPVIPLTGIDGIPLLHEFEFEILLPGNKQIQ